MYIREPELSSLFGRPRSSFVSRARQTAEEKHSLLEEDGSLRFFATENGVEREKERNREEMEDAAGRKEDGAPVTMKRNVPQILYNRQSTLLPN